MTINMGMGADTIRLDVDDANAYVFEADTSFSIEGSSGTDTLSGTENSEMIWGAGGSDSIDAGGGDDTLDAGIFATEGTMSSVAATLSGGSGNDLLSFDLYTSTNTNTYTTTTTTTTVTGEGSSVVNTNTNEVTTTTTDLYVNDQGSVNITDFTLGEDLLQFNYVDGSSSNSVVLSNFITVSESGDDRVITMSGEGGNLTITLEDFADDGDFNSLSSLTSAGALVYVDDYEPNGAEFLEDDVLSLEGAWTVDNQSIRADSNDQRIQVDDFASYIDMGAGNDTLYGGNTSGSRSLVGGDGDDSIRSLNEEDSLFGGTGNDTLRLDYDGGDNAYGGTGDDSVAAYSIDGEFDGGAGNDTLDFTGIEGGTGLNFGDIEASNFEVLTLGAGNDTFADGDFVRVYGGGGDDLFDFTETVPLYVDGGSGNDSLDFSAYTSDVNIEVTNLESIVGGSGNDSIEGISGSATVDGGVGDDTMVVTGSLSSSASIVGGAGNDEVIFETTVDPSSPINEAMGIETISLDGDGSYHDYLSIAGTTSGVHVEFGGGNDTISGGSDNDTYSGLRRLQERRFRRWRGHGPTRSQL